MKNIQVTQSFLPPQEEFEKYLTQIWESKHLTNQGPLLKELEKQLSKYLAVGNLHFVTNGTMALQLALQALDILEGEIITTPFSYVATTSAILWERCTPVFVDIDPSTLCIDPSKIEAAITKHTKAIMAVHVFGNIYRLEDIEEIAKRHGLKVIYDAAHAFGVKYKGQPIFGYGDISVGSFHATKLFHTIEGGCLVVKDKNVSDNVELMKRFGHQGDEHIMLGINAKASEFQAAMGLANIPYIDSIIEQRKQISVQYDNLLPEVKRPNFGDEVQRNYAYYPIILKDEESVLSILKALAEMSIYPRRYFYPSLNKLPYVNETQTCPISERMAKQILCLPFYPGLDATDIKSISKIVNQYA